SLVHRRPQGADVLPQQGGPHTPVIIGGGSDVAGDQVRRQQGDPHVEGGVPGCAERPPQAGRRVRVSLARQLPVTGPTQCRVSEDGRAEPPHMTPRGGPVRVSPRGDALEKLTRPLGIVFYGVYDRI